MSKLLGVKKFRANCTTESFMELLPLPCLPNVKKNSSGDLTKTQPDIPILFSEEEDCAHRDSVEQEQQVNSKQKLDELLISKDENGKETAGSITSDFLGFPSKPIEEEELPKSDNITHLKNKCTNTNCSSIVEKQKQNQDTNGVVYRDRKENKNDQNKPTNDKQHELSNSAEVQGIAPKSGNVSVNLNYQKFCTIYPNNNKYSSETTSEFPLSSPRTLKSYRGNYTQRQVSLKNTLPANSFGRKLALLTSTNPQMTFQEKLSAWNCDTELSDVEDVNNFDDMFQNYEENMKQLVQAKEDGLLDPRKLDDINLTDNYSFTVFRNNLIKSLNKKAKFRNMHNERDNRIESQAVSTAFNKNPQRPIVKAALYRNANPANHKIGKFIGNCTTSTGTSVGGNGLKEYRNSMARRCFMLSRYNKDSMKKVEPSSSDETNTKMSKISLRPYGRAVDMDAPSEGLIKCRLDCDNQNKGIILKERKNELFKDSPVIPSKVIQKTKSILKNEKEHTTNLEAHKSPCLMENNKCDENDKGFFHQQHEFCNYLGLTGMSTANAVANAVAELAQCNLTRRSLRVHRIQQQEKTKSCSGKKEIESECVHETPCIQNNDVPPECCTTANTTATTVMSGSKNSEIKIICQIAAPTKEDAEKISKNYVTKITKTIQVQASSTKVIGKISHSDKNTVNELCHVQPPSEHSILDNEHPRSTNNIIRLPQKRNRNHSSINLNGPQSNIAIKSIITSCPQTEIPVELHNSNLMYDKTQRSLHESRQIEPNIFIVSEINSTPKCKTEHQCSQLQDSQTVNSCLAVNNRNGSENISNAYLNNMQIEKVLERKFKKNSLYKVLKKSLSNLHNRRNLLNRKYIVVRFPDKRGKPKMPKNSVKSMISVFQTPVELKTIKRRNNKNNNKKLPNTQENVKMNQRRHTRNSKNFQHSVEEDAAKSINLLAMNVPSTNNTFNGQLDKKNSEGLVEKLPKIKKQDNSTQTDSLHFISKPNQSSFYDPLNKEYGSVLYIFYENNLLLVVQELSVSFWKFSSVVSTLTVLCDNFNRQEATNYDKVSSTLNWILLGECRRLTNDLEIQVPYSNRLCMNGSSPMYIEMRCRELPRGKRECNLLFLYVNAYHYLDTEMHARMYSIQLDAIQSVPECIIYTTIPDTRYFVMAWPQENILNKTLSGLCKYSLTPYLDTLASIRDFKNLRHDVSQLDCIGDDKLIGIGITQLTIWDHRSGDVLMNYDLNMHLGRNLGSIYYPSCGIEQSNLLLLIQYVRNTNGEPEMLSIACNVSHTTPMHRILRRCKLPEPAFNNLTEAINTGDHLILKAKTDEEIWISCTDPSMITCVPSQHTNRFYTRGKAMVVEINHKNQILTVDSFANHILKLAATSIL